VKKAAAIAGADGCADWAAGERALLQQVNVVPFANSTVPIFGKGATFELSDGVSPASIRMVG
jgi:peptide/nickel transport system substrate-binding protein